MYVCMTCGIRRVIDVQEEPEIEPGSFVEEPEPIREIVGPASLTKRIKDSFSNRSTNRILVIEGNHEVGELPGVKIERVQPGSDRDLFTIGHPDSDIVFLSQSPRVWSVPYAEVIL
jgi:hypothetical protein